MGLTEFIIDTATLFIEKTGYLGITILMTLESMIAPVPSEAVMPFAGFLWYENTLTFTGIMIASTVGSLVGSLISYYLGAYAGRPFIRAFGKYFLLNEHHLDQTEKFFKKYGEKAVFVSRFIPVVRHFISLPAGVGRMNIVKFSLYTVCGAGLWNAFLAWLGFQLGARWSVIKQYSEIIDIAVVLIILAAAIHFFYRRWKSPSKHSTVS
ncbi:MAG: DedA family protein [Patescibacteria group bacterium]